MKLTWMLQGFGVVDPPELAGARLEKLRAWIDRLEPDLHEAARLLRWGVMIAHGRAIPLAEQSDATKMPPNCFTFQPAMAVRARRVGVIRDFSAGDARPLDGRVEAQT